MTNGMMLAIFAGKLLLHCQEGGLVVAIYQVGVPSDKGKPNQGHDVV